MGKTKNKLKADVVVKNYWRNNEQFADFFNAVLYEGKHIGAAGVSFGNGCGELGWIINKQYWGHGFAYEGGGRRKQSAQKDSYKYQYELDI